VPEGRWTSPGYGKRDAEKVRYGTGETLPGSLCRAKTACIRRNRNGGFVVAGQPLPVLRAAGFWNLGYELAPGSYEVGREAPLTRAALVEYATARRVGAQQAEMKGNQGDISPSYKEHIGCISPS